MRFLKTTTVMAAMAFGITGAAQASDPSERSFTYNKSATVAATYTSLKTQAKKVCERELGPLMHYGAKSCIRAYVSDVIGQIDSLELTAYHQRQSGQKTPVIQLAQIKK